MSSCELSFLAASWLYIEVDAALLSRFGAGCVVGSFLEVLLHHTEAES